HASISVAGSPLQGSGGAIVLSNPGGFITLYSNLDASSHGTGIAPGGSITLTATSVRAPGVDVELIANGSGAGSGGKISITTTTPGAAGQLLLGDSLTQANN